MSTIASLETLLTANTSQHDSAINKSEQTLGHLSTTGAQSGNVLQDAFHKAGEGAGEAGLKINQLIPGFSALGLGIAGVVGFLTEATKAAMEGQVANDLLTQSLNNNVQGWQSQSSALNEAIEARIKFGFTDDQLKNSMAQLVTRTHDVTKAIDLQATALDLARGRHIDLATATSVLGKVYDGNVGILSRYGVAVEKGASATEALAKVQQTFAGASQTYSESAAGGMDRLKASFDEALEKIGTAFLPIIASLTDVLSALIPPIVSVATVLLTILKPAFDVIVFILNGAATVLNWVGGLFSGFSDTVTESSNTAAQGFQALPQGIQSGADATQSVLGDLQTSFSDTVTSASDSGTAAGEGYGYNLSDGIYSYQSNISDQVGGALDTLDVSDQTGGIGYTAGSAWAGQSGVNGALADGGPVISKSTADIVNSMDHKDAAASIGYATGKSYYDNLKAGATGGAPVGTSASTVATAQAPLFGKVFPGVSLPISLFSTETQNWLNSQIGTQQAPAGTLPGQLPNQQAQSTAEQEAAWKAAHGGVSPGSPDYSAGYTNVPTVASGYPNPASIPGFTQNHYMASDGTWWESQFAADTHDKLPYTQPTVAAPKAPSAPHSSTGGGGGGGSGAGSSATGGKVVDAIKEAEDQAKSLSDAVDAGMSAISKLGEFKLPANFDAGVDGFADAVDHIMMKLQDVSLKFKDDALAHISLFSDSAKSGMELVSTGVDALVKLKDFAAPTAGSVDAFTNAVQYVTNKLGDVAKSWTVDSLALLGEFSDSTGKAMDMVSKSIDTLAKFKDFKKPTDDSMNAFVDATDYLTDKLRKVEAKWDVASLDLAAKFGSDTSTLMDGVGKSVDNLSKLVDFVRPADYSIDSFFGAFDQVVQKVSDRARKWYGLINKDVADLSGYVGGAVNGMLGAVDGLSKLGNPAVTLPGIDGVDKYFDSLDLILPKISERSRTWYGLVNQGISETAGYIGSAVTGLLGAVDGMTKLASPDTKVPSGSQIDAFFDSLDLMAPKISDRTRQWYGLFNKSSADLAGYVGTAASGLLSAIDPMSKIVDFKKPTQAEIDDVFDSLDMFLTEFDKSAASFQEKAGPVAADVATRVGTVAAGIGAAFDPLTKVADVQKVTKDQIQGAMSNVWELLNQTQIVMAGIPADFPAKAATFGTSVNEIFSAVKSGFDVATSVGGDTGGSIGQGFAEALTQAEALVNYLNVDGTSAMSSFGTATDNLRTQVVDDWGDMAEAANNYIKTISGMPQTQVPPGQTPPNQTPPPPAQKNPPLNENTMRVPPLTSQSTSAGTTVMHNPVFLNGIQVAATADEHALLVSIGRRDRRKKGGTNA